MGENVTGGEMEKEIVLEACNRCCARDYSRVGDVVRCHNCGHEEVLSDWQLIGWRDIKKNPPVFSGTIHVYGKGIGRTMALWESKTQSCDNPEATHWLRVPDPTKQVGM